jgi:hypothetical protein
MKLVALVRPAPRPEDAARAVADATGLTPAEARMRLAPEPPALLARLEPDAAARLVAALRKAGLAVLAVDASCPTDKDRTVAQAFALDDAGLVCTPRFGEPLAVGWGDVTVILRGARAARTEVRRAEKSQRLSVGTALATGGLKLTRTTTAIARAAEESSEQVVLVYARDGRAAMLGESELDFSCLAAGMQPSSTANMAELARRLRAGAKGAFYDERLLRLGRRPLPFLGGGESRTLGSRSTTTRTDTSGTLDTLAEMMRQAVAEGLLP